MDAVLKAIASTPSAPFVYRPARDLILRLLAEQSIPGLSVKADPFGLYVRVRRGKPARQLLVVTHLDHPAIVLQNEAQGIVFGSVGYDRLLATLQVRPIPVRLYDPAGSFQQLAKVCRFAIRFGRPTVFVETEKPVLANSHAIWDIPPFEETDQVIRMYNADNGVATAAALQLLFGSPDCDDIDTQVIFTFVEEVHQHSSTGIAARGATPFGTIDKDTIIVNLEAMELITTQSEEAAIRHLGFSEPEYDKGVLIKVNDGQIVYGNHFPEAKNQAESIVMMAAEKHGIRYQHTVTAGSTDAKSFSLFPLTPHIVTIAIPCRWKHNFGQQGEFVPEEVYKRDLQSTVSLLREVAVNSSHNDETQSSLSASLKQMGYGLSPEQSRSLAVKQVRLMKSVYPRLLKGKYFPESRAESVEFASWKLLAKVSR